MTKMRENEKNPYVHEPLFHIVKRDDVSFFQSSLVRVIAFAAALVFCSLLAFLLIGANPMEFFESIFSGSFGSSRRIWKLLKDIAILLCISLAVTPAFRMRFWNIGAEGQVLVGALACTACIYYLGGKLNEPLLILCMFVAALLAGAAWAVIPAVFKAIWNTNETLFTLMMNYVATFLVAFCLIEWTPNGSSSIGELKYGHLPSVVHPYFLIIVAVLLLTGFMYVYLNYSKHGYELSVVGESEKTARYVGINVKKVIIRTMIVSGLICGLAGFLIVGGLDHSITENTVGGRGFTAIMVSWLAKFNPLLMLLTSFLLVFLNQGAAQLSQDFDISSAFPDVIVGVILFFIIGCEFFIRYRICFRSAKKGGKKHE